MDGKRRKYPKIGQSEEEMRQETRTWYILWRILCCLIGIAGFIIAIIALVEALKDPCGSVVCNLDNPCAVEECQKGTCVVLQDIPGCCVNDTECDDGDACTTDLCTNNTCMNFLPNTDSCSFQYQCADTHTCTNCTCLETCDVATCQVEFGNPCLVTGCIEGSCEMVHLDQSCCTLDFQCTDFNQCTTDICNVLNQCEHIKSNETVCAHDTDCSPFQFCEDNCTCVDYIPSQGECILNSDCVDNSTCTLGLCEKDCSCDFISVPGCCTNATECEDGNACHTNFTCDNVTGLCSFAIIDGDNDGVPCSLDCNDTNNSTGAAPTWYRDQDGDGSGTLSAFIVACEQPEGFSATSNDCDDDNPTIFPGSNQCDVEILGNQFIIIPDDQQFDSMGDPVGNQQFGYAVDIEGDILAISAPNDRADNGTNPPIGSVRIFERDSGQVFVFVVNITEPLISESGDGFGHSVALCSESDILVIGSPFADKNGSSSGEVFVYERNSTAVWLLRTRLVSPDPGVGNEFGTAVACFNTTVVVGEPGTVNGTVHVFDRLNTTVWNLTQSLSASDAAAAAEFGNAIAIDQTDGDPILIGAHLANVSATVGAGQVYVFNLTLGTWGEVSIHSAPTPVTGGSFGGSVDIDQGFFVVGSAFDSDGSDTTGSAYVFEDTAGTWGFLYKLLTPDRQPSDGCGTSVAIKNSTIIVSCPNDDTVQADTGSLNVFSTDGTWVGKMIPIDAATTLNIFVGDTPRSADVWGDTMVGGARSVDVYATDDGQAYVGSCIPVQVC